MSPSKDQLLLCLFGSNTASTFTGSSQGTLSSSEALVFLTTGAAKLIQMVMSCFTVWWMRFWGRWGFQISGIFFRIPTPNGRGLLRLSS